MERAEVYKRIDEERDHQDSLPPYRTDGVAKSVGSYLALMDVYLHRAKAAYAEKAGDVPALDEIRKVVALAVHCHEAHGCPPRAPANSPEVAARLRRLKALAVLGSLRDKDAYRHGANKQADKQADPAPDWRAGSELSAELWREYSFIGPGPVKRVVRITDPRRLYIRPGGTTHRVQDDTGEVVVVPAPGQHGCVLNYMPRDPANPVQF